MKNIFKLIIFNVILVTDFLISIPPINIFRPSDRPLLPEPLPGVKYQFLSGDETSYKTQAFQENFNDFHSIYCPEPERQVNVMRIYQDKQNLVAALKGVQSQTNVGQFLQKFNITDENGASGIYTPSGKLSVPYNILLSYRQYFPHNLILAFYLPVLSMELKDVKWREISDSKYLENTSNIYRTAKEYGDLDIGPWKRFGIGDFVAQGIFMADFPQKRPLIQNVRPQLRLAVTFPTAKRADVDKLLAFSFGNDGAWGTMTSAGLDVFFTPFFKAGFDCEFLFLFGNTAERRIKTNCDQTDFLLFTKLPAFESFGINQQFNLYTVARWRFLQFKLDYQYFKNHESKLYVFSNEVNPAIANSAEYLQDWSAHSFIFSVRCYFDDHISISAYKPAIFGFLKLGFNGERAILIDSLGLTLTSNF